jgi:Protein of unknown function (DUF2469)
MAVMATEDLERYEADMELSLYREYRDVVGQFKYVVETDRRFYLCNAVDVKVLTFKDVNVEELTKVD